MRILRLGASGGTGRQLVQQALERDEIVGAMQAHGVRRVLWESSLGIGETRGQLVSRHVLLMARSAL